MSYLGNLTRALFGLPPDDRWWATLSKPPVERSLGEWDELLQGLNAGSAFARYGLTTVSDVRLAFQVCSPLRAIVAQKAFAFTKGEVTVWNPATKKPVRGQFKEWERLMRNPNPLQSQRQFLTQAYSYCQQYGYCVIDPIYPAGFNDRPASLRVLPNWLIDWEWNRPSYGQPPSAAYFNAGGVREKLDVERLIIIRDSASTEFDANGWLPVSRFAPLEAEVSNIVAALNARGEMITDRGANGLVTNTAKDSYGVQPMAESEKERLQAAWSRRNGGIMRGQHKVLFTDAALAYTPMTFNVTELGLHPEHVADVKAICNVAAFPFTMLAEGYEGKYNNSTNSRRDFHDTTIDPESMDFLEQLSRGMGMYRDNCEMYMDYSGVASVQASQREKGIGEQSMAQALQTEWDLGIVTRNEIRERLGMERVTGQDGEFDKYKFETDSAIAAQEQINNNRNGQGQEGGQAGQADNGGNQSGGGS